MIDNGAPPVVTVPADLMVTRIRRANPSIGKEAARQMAAELYDIVECARKYCAAAKPSLDFDVDDFIRILTHRIVDDPSPPDSAAYKAAVADAAQLMRRFTALGGHAYFLRYMRLVDRINGTDIVGKHGLDHKSPAKAKRPVPFLVRDDLPPLDAIMQAVTAAVRLAQRGEGPRKILELMPAFKDATGLDFVMQATEAHRGALFDLARNAGIPVKKGDSK